MTKSIARKKYDADTASGPPCSECGAEMAVEVYMSNNRHFFQCKEHRNVRMTMAQGWDTLELLRSQKKRAHEARSNAELLDIDPAIGVLGDILADSIALNNDN